MNALLPVYCRLLGYFIIALALFLPFLMFLMGRVTDANLLFYKECAKLLMMMGALMIIFALSKHESEETVKVRNKAVRNAMFLTVLYVFGIMLYRVAQGDVFTVDGSSFLIFLFINVLCLEFGIKKSSVNRLFRGNGR
jgi:membrane-associated HD superfamily phosphohydrolase